MTSPQRGRNIAIVLSILGLGLACSVILLIVLVFADPFDLGIDEKIFDLFGSGPALTTSSNPTPDLCLITQGPLIVGCPAPSFNLNTFDRQEMVLEELGGKVVVINFWASWAIPCEGEAAILQTAWENYQERDDIVFIGINWLDTDPNASEYIQRIGLSYPTGADIGGHIAEAYRISGVPETYVVDQEGRLAFVKVGPFLSVDEVRAAVEALLAP